MYVCLCHGFTTTDVTREVTGGCRSVAAFYRNLGVRPQCGKCVSEVRRLVRGAKPSEGGGAEPAGDAD